MIETQDNIETILENLFSDHPDGDMAKSFILGFNEYCHRIDDIIDEKLTDAEVVCTTHMLALNLFSSNFYRKYSDVLYPVIVNIHHTWLDSVQMEKSSNLQSREQAVVLKSVGIEMLLMVVQILGGYEKRRKYSVLIRENNFRKQNPSLDIS